jgi:hypothetical protein
MGQRANADLATRQVGAFGGIQRIANERLRSALDDIRNEVL